VLLSNAVKFTAKGSISVEITTERVAFPVRLVGSGVLASEIDADLRVVVKDTGVGIAKGHRSRLFLPFVQGDGSTSRAHEGIGLGLAIAYKLARSAGGDLTVDPEGASAQGTCFRLILPARC